MLATTLVTLLTVIFTFGVSDFFAVGFDVPTCVTRTGSGCKLGGSDDC